MLERILSDKVQTEVMAQSKYEVVEVLLGLKQTALVVNFEVEGCFLKALFRPENGLEVSIDVEIPKPEELYRDCAFSEICSGLGLEFVPLVVPWSMGEEKGVLRQYWEKVDSLQPYQINRKYLSSIDGGGMWRKIAVIDYVFGVSDRVANDILITSDGIKVVDNGYSFVTGIDLNLEMSVLRKLMTNENIEDIITEFEAKRIREQIIASRYLNDNSKYWAIQRFAKLAEAGVVL